MRILLAALAILLLPAQERLVIRVAPEGWGDAATEDIEKVLRSAGESLVAYVPTLKLPALEVSRSRTGNPIVLYERGPAGEIRVKLDVENRRWAQFAFQFGHEMGHIVCGYAEYRNPNHWFEETICETASLFVLGRMAESWKTSPPYPNWKSYAASLKQYREERIGKEGLPEGTTLADWFRPREESLRKDGTQRALNLTMAIALLPLFEESPGSWEALTALNAVRGDATRTFAQYLKDWQRSTSEKHRPFVAKIAGRFGVSLD